MEQGYILLMYVKKPEALLILCFPKSIPILQKTHAMGSMLNVKETVNW